MYLTFTMWGWTAGHGIPARSNVAAGNHQGLWLLCAHQQVHTCSRGACTFLSYTAHLKDSHCLVIWHMSMLGQSTSIPVLHYLMCGEAWTSNSIFMWHFPWKLMCAHTSARFLLCAQVLNLLAVCGFWPTLASIYLNKLHHQMQKTCYVHLQLEQTMPDKSAIIDAQNVHYAAPHVKYHGYWPCMTMWDVFVKNQCVQLLSIILRESARNVCSYFFLVNLWYLHMHGFACMWLSSWMAQLPVKLAFRSWPSQGSRRCCCKSQAWFRLWLRGKLHFRHCCFWTKIIGACVCSLCPLLGHGTAVLVVPFSWSSHNRHSHEIFAKFLAISNLMMMGNEQPGRSTNLWEGCLVKSGPSLHTGVSLEAWVWTKFILLHKGCFVHSCLISSTSCWLQSSVPKG